MDGIDVPLRSGQFHPGLHQFIAVAEAVTKIFCFWPGWGGPPSRLDAISLPKAPPERSVGRTVPVLESAPSPRVPLTPRRGTSFCLLSRSYRSTRTPATVFHPFWLAGTRGKARTEGLAAKSRREAPTCGRQAVAGNRGVKTRDQQTSKKWQFFILGIRHGYVKLPILKIYD
jgi:hypothetical protein